MAKLTKLQKEALLLMVAIVEATRSEVGYKMADGFTCEYLVELGYVEINHDIKDDEGNVAVRATTAGIDSIGTVVEETSAPEVPKANIVKETVKTAFEIETGIEVPKSLRGRGIGNTKYPFANLEVNGSFFVPGKTTKQMASIVSGATARFAVDGEGTKTNKAGATVAVKVNTRKFVVRDAEKDGVTGARIWRLALEG